MPGGLHPWLGCSWSCPWAPAGREGRRALGWGRVSGAQPWQRVLVLPEAPRQGDAGAVPALGLCPCTGLGQGERSWLLTPTAPLPALVLAVSIRPSRAAAEVPWGLGVPASWAGSCWCRQRCGQQVSAGAVSPSRGLWRSAVWGGKAMGLVSVVGQRGELGSCRSPLFLPGLSSCRRRPSLRCQGLWSRLAGVRLQRHVLRHAGPRGPASPGHLRQVREQQGRQAAGAQRGELPAQRQDHRYLPRLDACLHTVQQSPSLRGDCNDVCPPQISISSWTRRGGTRR